MKKLLFIPLIFIQNNIYSQQIPLTIGQKAPNFSLYNLRGYEDIELNKIDKNKIIVIEFWATWCVPCVQEFQHLNNLQKKFLGKNVVFISVTYESNRAKLDSFLARHPLNTVVALDKELQIFRDYAAWAIPQILIIDKARNIVVSIHPTKLTEQIIQDVMDGKKIDIPENGKQTYFDPKGAEEYFRKIEKEGKN